MIQAATEVAPQILQTISELELGGGDKSSVDVANELSKRMLSVVGPAVAKMTEFEALLLEIAFGPGKQCDADNATFKAVTEARDEAAELVFKAAETEVGFWGGLVKRATKGLGSATQPAQTS